MVFYQAAAPTGWTQVVTQNDKALRVVSGAGGGTGGSAGLSGSIVLAHSHTVNSHTHTVPSTDTQGGHSHTVNSHTHTISSDLTTHFHTTVQGGVIGSYDGSVNNGSWPYSSDIYSGTLTFNDAQGATSVKVNPSLARTSSVNLAHTHGGVTGAATLGTDTQGAHAHSASTTGASSPGTDSQLSSITLAYVDVLLCSKN